MKKRLCAAVVALLLCLWAWPVLARAADGPQPGIEVVPEAGGPLGVPVVPVGCTAGQLAAAMQAVDTGPVTLYMPVAYEDFFGGSWPYSWDAAAIDTTARGAYTPYRFETPENTWVNPANKPVLVVDPSEADLAGLYLLPAETVWYGVPQLHCRWLRPVQGATLWHCVVAAEDEPPGTGAAWAQIVTVGFSADDAQTGDIGFRLSTLGLQAGYHWFQVRHAQGESEPALVRIAPGEAEVLGIGGDRDGGDGGEQPPPGDVEQPPPGTPPGTPDGPGAGGTDTPDAPAPPTENTPAADGGDDPPPAAPAQPGTDRQGGADEQQPAATPAPERLTETETEISGLRLAAMLAQQGGSVLFSKSQVSIWLDADFLAGLALADTDTLLVRLEKPDENSFALYVAVNGMPLDAIPGTAVQVQLAPPAEGAALYCVDAEGNEVCPAAYDTAMGVARLTLDAPGHYTLAPQGTGGEAMADAVTPLAAPPGGGGWPLLAWGLGGAALACGGGLSLLFIRRRRRLFLESKAEEA